MELEDKTIIITGASSGIGAAAATLFAAEGANVVLGARRSAELKALAGAINRSNGRAVFVAGDVKDETYAEVSSLPGRSSVDLTVRSTTLGSSGRCSQPLTWASATGTTSSR